MREFHFSALLVSTGYAVIICHDSSRISHVPLHLSSVVVFLKSRNECRYLKALCNGLCDVIAVSQAVSTRKIALSLIISHCVYVLCLFQREKRGFELSTDEQEALAEWRDTEIEEGAYVDYLFHNRWKYGQIKKIVSSEDPETGAKYHRMAIQPQMPDIWPMYHRSRRGRTMQNDQEFTENFNLNSKCLGQIAKPLTKSVELMPHMMEWRKQLTADEESDEKYRKCDVLDSVRKWYTCTILEESQAMNKFKIRYDGWSQRYDEWVCR